MLSKLTLIRTRSEIGSIAVGLVLSVVLAGTAAEPTTAPEQAVPVSSAAGARASSPQQARRQAEILHTAIHATLQLVHDNYYREDEGLPIPAAMLGDVFVDLEKQQQVTLRWLAVEGQAMNVDHKPQDEFERQAFAALKAGQPRYEATENGVYRHAGPIRLGNHCLKCHVPDRTNTNDRTAGLIIAIPLEAK